MQSKKIFSLILLLIMIMGAALVTVFADTVTNIQSVEVNLTAQADGAFLCAPQFGIKVDSNTAEIYGFEDSVDGVSVLDALVTLHKIKYGNSFTKDAAGNYLALNDYGSTSKSFGYSDRYAGFVLNGAYPNDGTESNFGGYNGSSKLRRNSTTTTLLNFSSTQKTGRTSLHGLIIRETL